MASKRVSVQKKRGPKNKNVDLEKIKNLSSRGLTKEEMAYALGLSPATLYVRIKENPEILDAIEEGRSKSILAVSNVIFQKAVQGSFQAASYWLEMIGRRTKPAQEMKVDSTENVKLGVVLLPEQMDREEWLKKYHKK